MAKKNVSAKPKYRGSSHLHDDAEIAFDALASTLTVTTTECETHTILRIEGFDSTETLQALAVYLVASAAQCIHADMQIRHALFDDATRTVELAADIQALVGTDASDDHFKTYTRDPWIWEGISHLIVHLSAEISDLHPSGTVLAKSLLKYDVNDHGLDLVAIYFSGSLGITAGESKAYLDDPSRAVTEASNRLREIDDHLRDAELRSTVAQLRPSLMANHQKMIGGAFWRDQRTYYPFVCHDETQAPDWGRNRAVLKALQIPASRKLLVPVSLKQARATFDKLSSLMREYANDNSSF